MCPSAWWTPLPIPKWRWRNRHSAGDHHMFNDQSLLFFGTNWSTAATVSATTTSAIFALTGAGSANAPAMIGGYPAKNTAMGFDIGVGDGEAIPQLYVAF